MSADAFDGCYAGRRVFVTGHSGFLGTWVVRWLLRLGAEVSGFSRGAYQSFIAVPDPVATFRGDIADAAAVAAAMATVRPEIVLHLAGGSSTPVGFRAPSATFASNVMGTVAVLEAALRESSVRCVAICGTPAVMPPGHDLVLSPYAGSKQAVEAVAASYGHPQTQRNLGRTTPIPIGVARPGVMMGGDWGYGRLLADSARAVRDRRSVTLNAPNAVRPWQHVLDGISGVLVLAARMYDGSAPHRRYEFGRAAPAEAETVRTVVERFLAEYGFPEWPIIAQGDGTGDRIELGSAAATAELGWRPVWDLDRTLAAAGRWYRTARDAAEELGAVMDAQIDQYATAASTSWRPGSAARVPGGRLTPIGA